MKKLAFIGIYILLLVITGLLFQIAYNQYVENGGDDVLGISNLKKEEEAYFKRISSPDRSGQVNQRRMDNYNRQDLAFTNPEISKFFRKDVPLDKPSIARTYVFAWSSLAVSDIMTFGYRSYKMRLSKSSRYFNDEGWKSFSAALKRSRIIEKIEQNQQIITAVPKGAPILQSSGVVDGVYQEVIEIPLVLTYMSGPRTMNQNLLVTVVVVRSNEEKHPMGIAIKQWIAFAH